MRPDPERVRIVLDDVVASEIAPHFGQLDAESIREKTSPTDLVTIVDEAAEHALKRALAPLAPGAGFIGEEAAASNPKIVAALAGEGSFWVVDPLDGTRNFVREVNEFGSIVAYVENGRTLMGWIYDIPNHNCVIAELGSGVEGLGQFRRGSIATPPLGLRSIGWLNPKWRERLQRTLNERTATHPDHCSAYAYLKMARGEYDFKISSRVQPWDHAAGALLLTELGGAARWLDDGVDYSPGEIVDRPYLTTSPGRDWLSIADLLLD
jgi:fructose-1,6-bisphosphatase/inositol monophosphatase family enzyme